MRFQNCLFLNFVHLHYEIYILDYYLHHYLIENHWFRKESFDYTAIVFEENNVRYKDIQAKHIIFAEGFGLHANPYFNQLPLDGTKGELFIIKAPELDLDIIVNTSVFILPLGNDLFKDLIQEGDVEYEVPGLVELEGMTWKGKADIVNHSQQLVIDLKTTGDISRFSYSAYKFNYDSQAYIYSQMFGYELVFIVIDKKTHQMGLFDCSDKFLHSGSNKVARAVQAYNDFFVTNDGDFSQYYISKTL